MTTVAKKVWRWAWPRALAVAVFASSYGSLLFGHQHNGAGEDYARYLQADGASCCSDQDCMPTRHAYTFRGDLVMFPWDTATPIAPEKINKERSRDGQAHICARRHLDGKIIVLCAILPEQGS